MQRRSTEAAEATESTEGAELRSTKAAHLVLPFGNIALKPFDGHGHLIFNSTHLELSKPFYPLQIDS